MSINRVTPEAIRAVVDALHQIRLDHNLTYDALAAAVGVSRRNLIRVMNDPAATTQDRTLHKMRLYVERTKAEAEQSGVRATEVSR